MKGAQTLFGLNYFYKQDSTNCPAGNTGNNGQIQCITDSVDAGRNATYVYDTLGRLSNASTAGSVNYPAWNLSFTYDRYGNRTAQNTSTVTINPQTNQISTLPYDLNGNMLNDGVNAVVYDAANRVVSNTQSSVVSTYAYDGKGTRAQKVSSGTTTVYIYSGSRVIAEYANAAPPASPTREYIYSNDQLLAKIEAGATSYYHPDQLSVRLLTDATGALLGQQGHFPYGDPWYDGLGSNKWKFTTYERDAESQNDYALARYYMNRLGRFASPDPLAGSPGNPQTLNRYAYVADDPINSVDPSGEFLLAFERRFQDLFLSAAAIAAGEGGMCMSDDMPTPCITGGNTIFDAIAGAPGTWISLTRRQILWGFDPDLWSETMNFIDNGIALAKKFHQKFDPTVGAFQVVVTNWGTSTTTEGLIPELIALQAAQVKVYIDLKNISLQGLTVDVPTGSPNMPYTRVNLTNLRKPNPNPCPNCPSTVPVQNMADIARWYPGLLGPVMDQLGGTSPNLGRAVQELGLIQGPLSSLLDQVENLFAH